MFSGLHTEKPYDLDITSFREKGEELKTAINNAVKDTQKVIVRALPDKIVMTQTQYKMLTRRPEFVKQDYFGQEYYFYKTPYNLMEVVVKDDGTNKVEITIDE